MRSASDLVKTLLLVGSFFVAVRLITFAFMLISWPSKTEFSSDRFNLSGKVLLSKSDRSSWHSFLFHAHTA